jgi:hypothetical protein
MAIGPCSLRLLRVLLELRAVARGVLVSRLALQVRALAMGVLPVGGSRGVPRTSVESTPRVTTLEIDGSWWSAPPSARPRSAVRGDMVPRVRTCLSNAHRANAHCARQCLTPPAPPPTSSNATIPKRSRPLTPWASGWRMPPTSIPRSPEPTEGKWLQAPSPKESTHTSENRFPK